MIDWINTKDKLPEYDTSVLVYYKTTKCKPRYGIAYYCYSVLSGKGVWILENNGNLLKNVLYWLPIPELPKE